MDQNILAYPVRTQICRIKRGVRFMDSSGQVLRKVGERTWSSAQRRHVAEVIFSPYKPKGSRLLFEGKALVSVQHSPRK